MEVLRTVIEVLLLGGCAVGGWVFKEQNALLKKIQADYVTLGRELSKEITDALKPINEKIEYLITDKKNYEWRIELNERHINVILDNIKEHGERLLELELKQDNFGKKEIKD